MNIIFIAKSLKDEDLSYIESNYGKARIVGSQYSITVAYFMDCDKCIQRHNNISFVNLRIDYKFLGTNEKLLSTAVYQYLKVNRYDAAIFLDEPSLGYYSVLASHEGLNGTNTRLIFLEGEAPEFDCQSGFEANLCILNKKEMEQKVRLYSGRFIRRVDLNQESLSGVATSRSCAEASVNMNKRFLNDDDNCNPLVSVCIVHYNRHVYLQGLIDCFQTQTWQDFEIILVDDGSDNLSSLQFIDSLQNLFDQKGWKIIRQANKYLGAARNSAAQAARGKYLVFSDDDNYPFDKELEVFVSVMERTGADILTCGANFFFDKEITERPALPEFYSVPFGNLPNSAFYENVFGDANCCVKKSAFSELGGFTEDYGVGYEDWEFFLRAAMRKMEILVIPEPLFWYRVHQGSMMDATDSIRNRQRVLRNIFRHNEFSEVLQLSNIEYINRNTGRLLPGNAIVNGLFLFLKSQRRSMLVKRFMYSCKVCGLRGAIKRFLYFGKLKL